MGITIEKIEGKEGLMRVLDMLSGGQASEHRKELYDAKVKLEAAGYSGNAMAALASFTAHIDELASAMSQAMVAADNLHNHDAATFALAALQWTTVGLNNCHDMLEKAAVDPNVFGLKRRSEGYQEFLQNRTREFRNKVQGYVEYTLTDPQGNTTKLRGVTEGEAAAEALTNLGYTLSLSRK